MIHFPFRLDASHIPFHAIVLMKSKTQSIPSQISVSSKDLSPLPLNAMSTTSVKRANDVLERSRGQVKVAVGAATTAVHDADIDAASMVVDVDVAPAGVLSVEETMAYGGDVVMGGVLVAAGSEAGLVVGYVAGGASRKRGGGDG